MKVSDFDRKPNKTKRGLTGRRTGDVERPGPGAAISERYRMDKAALLLEQDYGTDDELTAFRVLDGESFKEG